MSGRGRDPEAAVEVRASRKVRWAGHLAGWLMRASFATLRVRLDDRCGLAGPDGLPDPAINVLWHSRIFVVGPALRKFAGRWRSLLALTSASHDGAALEAAMRVLGIGAVRGSSSRRAVAGLIGLRRALRAGSDVAITPDGPRGPRYRVQPGVVKLAQSTGAPVVPLHVRYSSAWRLRTWDRFVIPKPFSKVTVVFGEALVVPRTLDDDGFEEWRMKIEQVLLDGVDDLDIETGKKRKHE